MLKATDSMPITPEEVLWWNTRREAAYDALARGLQPGEAAEQFNLPPRTLYNWRHHPYWRDRREHDLLELRQTSAERLAATDALAVRVIGEHISKSGPVALRYLHLRGVLTRPGEDDMPEDLKDLFSDPALFPDDDPEDLLADEHPSHPLAEVPA